MKKIWRKIMEEELDTIVAELAKSRPDFWEVARAAGRIQKQARVEASDERE